MTVALFLLLLLIGFYFYNQLQNRIDELKKQIDDLKGYRTAQPTAEVPKEEKPSATNLDSHPVILQNKRSEDMISENKTNWIDLFSNFIRENILTVLGIITLILGVGYFVKYAIDKNWIGETARVSIGVFGGLAIAFTGFLLRKNYRIYSYILTGGAVVMLYFSINLGFREYHLFSQTSAFIVLIGITLFAIALAYFYSSEVLILIATIGGFCAPLMVSTGESNYPFLFGYITLLNFGMLAITFLKNWKSLGWVCFVLSSLYFSGWVFSEQQMISTIYLYLFYFTFYAFALADMFRQKVLQKFDIMMLVLINIFVVAALVYVFKVLDYEPVILIPISFAVINAVFLLREIKSKNYDTNFSVFSGLIISLLTFSVAVYLNNYVMTSFWATESVLLMFLWQKTGQSIFKRFFKYIFCLMIIAQIFTWSHYYDSDNLPLIANKVFITSFWTGLSVIANLIVVNYFDKNKESRSGRAFGLLSLAAFVLFYFIFLFELYYHIRELENNRIIILMLFYSVYYAAAVLVLQSFVKIGDYWDSGLGYLLLGLFIGLSGFATVTDSILVFRSSNGFFGLYLLYLIPLVYLIQKLFRNKAFLTADYNVWLLMFTIIFVICCEINHLYLVYSIGKLQEIMYLQERFVIFYLPIIWAVLGVSMIYFGIRRSLPELTKCGFALIGLMIIKLYAYDIWKMDNISRIIAFIALGLILLISSFTFQKLKLMLRKVIDKDKNSES